MDMYKYVAIDIRVYVKSPVKNDLLPLTIEVNVILSSRKLSYIE